MTQSTRRLVVATRGSTLARAQADAVIARLADRHPDVVWQTHVVRTEGDRNQAPLSVIGGRGVFVKELEVALLAGEADLAVHSLKDMPTEQPPGLTIAAVPGRADPRDALISRAGAGLRDLPPGAAVGTSAPRRAAQLRALRPDLRLVEIRGNVDTRLTKLRTGQYDAIVLAAAGLARLGRLGEATEILPLEVMLPAVAQGALAIECRADDAWLLERLAALDDPAARAAVTAERTFLRAMGGGCQLPIAAYAEPVGDTLLLRALVAGPDDTPWRAERTGPSSHPAALGESLAALVPPAWRSVAPGAGGPRGD